MNCRIAAREATLGCGPNGPRNDRKIQICTDHCVIARSEATWQSPGAMFVPAQQIDRCYQEIPTGLTALGMTVFSYLGGKKRHTPKGMAFFGDPLEIRTPDPLLKRQLLCRLS